MQAVSTIGLDIANDVSPLSHSGSAVFGIDGWRQIAERAVRSEGIVIILPDRQSRPSCFRSSRARR